MSEDIFHHGPPRPPEEMEELEGEVGARFPDDYRAVLLEVGPCAIAGPKIRFNLDLISTVSLSVDDDYIVEQMPGIVLIGNDGGDYAYYFDPQDRLGRGAFALYFVEMGTLSFDESRFVATSLSDAIDQVLAGENFRERPKLGN